MKKTIVKVRLTVDVEVEDSGYLGWDSTVQQHIDHVKKDVTSYWTVGIKKGATEFKAHPSKMEVVSVRLEDS